MRAIGPSLKAAPPSILGVLSIIGAPLLLGPALGCVDERQPIGPSAPACAGGFCPPSGGGTTPGGTGATGGGPGDGGLQGVPVTGNVVVTSSETFETFTPYAGEAEISAPGIGGATSLAPYGAATGATFSLDDIQSGLTWFLVRDVTSGGAGILSTRSPVFLPAGPSISLPVVDRAMLQTVAMSLGTFLDPEAAQVVVRVRRGGAPLSGVSVTNVGSGFVAYDEGAGVYSDAASGTGGAGVILLLNAAGEGALGTLAVTLGDGGKTYPLEPFPVVAGGATLADYEL